MLATAKTQYAIFYVKNLATVFVPVQIFVLKNLSMQSLKTDMDTLAMSSVLKIGITIEQNGMT